MPSLSDTPSAVLPGPALPCSGWRIAMCPTSRACIHVDTGLAGPPTYGRPAPLRGNVAEYRTAPQPSGSAPAGVSDSRKTTEHTLSPRRSHRRLAGAYARRHGLVPAERSLLRGCHGRGWSLAAARANVSLWGRRRRRLRAVIAAKHLAWLHILVAVTPRERSAAGLTTRTPAEVSSTHLELVTRKTNT
jgi:hypothetical protein